MMKTVFIAMTLAATFAEASTMTCAVTGPSIKENVLVEPNRLTQLALPDDKKIDFDYSSDEGGSALRVYVGRLPTEAEKEEAKAAAKKRGLGGDGPAIGSILIDFNLVKADGRIKYARFQVANLNIICKIGPPVGAVHLQ